MDSQVSGNIMADLRMKEDPPPSRDLHSLSIMDHKDDTPLMRYFPIQRVVQMVQDSSLPSHLVA